MTRTRIAIATLLLLTAAALTSCEVYPSGCVRIPHNEIPHPATWHSGTLAVHWQHDGTQTFTGISGASPWYDLSDTWHGPLNYTGWNEYLSARRCYETGGVSSQP